MPYSTFPDSPESPRAASNQRSNIDSLRELFASIADDNEKDFDTLFYTWSPRVQLVVKDYIKDESTIPELVNDVFLQIWLKKERLALVENPKAWIKKVTINICLNHIRSTKDTSFSFLHESSLIEDPEELRQAQHLREILRNGVARLPDRQRTIFIMRKELGLSHGEIARELKISVNTVKNHLASALKSLQADLARQGEVYLPLMLIALLLN